ncbi:zinc ribbon domain-containing protein [Salinibacterium sp. M195]|uniref:zinc ribbon domain-containing protein n=1 Tax=Salinibacterium sp. M195 TaxID=2583374 RepID=UPI00351CF4D7
MGDIPQTASCPACAGDAPRIFSSPLLNFGNAGARRLLDATNATADAPQVVGSLPSGSRRPQRVTYDPRAQKLPRA